LQIRQDRRQSAAASAARTTVVARSGRSTGPGPGTVMPPREQERAEMNWRGAYSRQASSWRPAADPSHPLAAPAWQSSVAAHIVAKSRKNVPWAWPTRTLAEEAKAQDAWEANARGWSWSLSPALVGLGAAPARDARQKPPSSGHARRIEETPA
jgi:hypothetical protein